ncbi:unnamed protein product [Caenorhabditis auriculariae]|uniref:Uncharacterized protein n=1 Tax=Caenorhabditis auriculariae TaxID=2777116 RepID=A0A8S1HAJ4_9PELO|nr:unnamed protein product [Caenorhabditis auriculariae]
MMLAVVSCSNSVIRTGLMAARLKISWLNYEDSYKFYDRLVRTVFMLGFFSYPIPMVYSVKWDQEQLLAKAVETDERLEDFIEQSAPFFLIYTKMIIVVFAATFFYFFLGMAITGFVMSR